MGNERRFPNNIQEILNKSGYFSLSREERIKANEISLEKLKNIPHIDYNAGRHALKEVRGE